MRTLTDSEIGLLGICISIGKERFAEYAASIAHSGAAEQFAKQARQADRLAELLGNAERVTVEQ